MKKIVSLFLALMICLSAMSVSVMAAEAETPDILAAVEAAVQEAEAETDASVETEPSVETEAGAADAEAAVTVAEERAETLYAGAVASGDCGNELTWSLSEEGVLTISGTGRMKAYSSSNAPWQTYCDGITKVIVEEGVTTVGNYAFYFCRSITAVELPDSLEEIGQYAFAYCSALESVEIPDAVNYIGRYAFVCCSGLKAIEIPADVKSILPYTFRECGSLAAVTLSEGLSAIGEFAFGHCDALETLTIPESVSSIDINAFYSCDGLREVSYPGTEEQWYAMEIYGGNAWLWAACPYAIPTKGSCGENVSWSVENGVLTISGEGAMDDNTRAIYAPWYDLAEQIKTVKIEYGVTYVGSYVLESSYVLEAILLAESVETVGSYAFRNCSVESVVLPESVTEVKANAFRASECEVIVLNRECVIGSNALGSGSVRGYYGSTAWAYAQENYKDFLPLDETVPVNERIFPDDNFRAYVDKTLARGDGVLTPEEIAAAVSIDCSGLGIASLVGIEFFPELKELNCSGNELTAMDLSASEKLEKLNCSGNALETMDIQSCSALTELNCSDCGLAVLDVSGCPDMAVLDCAGNGLSVLNLRKNPLLKALVEENAPVVTDGVAVYSADGLRLTMDAETPVESGAAGQLLAIDEVNFPDSSFRAYIRGEITSNETGESLFQGDANRDGYLSEEELLAVTAIDVSDVYWEDGICQSLEGIEYFAALEILNCGYQGLTELDLTGNPKLREVIAYKCAELEVIDLSNCPELELLKCYHTGISELDLSGNPKLKHLNASEINLTALDVTGCPELEYLSCGGNRIEKLDVSQNPNLIELHCYNKGYFSGFAGLTELDVSNCPRLEYLDVSMNSLTELDLSENPKLTTLIAYSNRLEELDVSQNTELTRLECNFNLFEELTIARVPAILNAYTDGTQYAETDYETGETATIYCVGDYDSRKGNILVVDDNVTVITEQPGDVTGDGFVRAEDLVLLMRYLAGEAAELAPGTGDTNGDGVIDILDVIHLVRKLADV